MFPHSAFNVMSGEPWEDSWVRRAWLTADLRILGRTRRRVQGVHAQQDQTADDQTEAQDERRVAQRREFRVGGGQRDMERPDQGVAKIRPSDVWRGSVGYMVG